MDAATACCCVSSYLEFVSVNCLNLLTCWKPSLFHCTFLQWLCGLRLRLLTAMGRVDMVVIWKDLVLQSKPLLVGCNRGHHTLWVCNLSLVNLTQDMPTHTWNPLNAFLFKICFSQEGRGLHYGDLHSWFFTAAIIYHCFWVPCWSWTWKASFYCRIWQYMTIWKGHWNSTCPPFIDL